MKKFRVIITERLRRVVIVNADSKEDARYKVEKQYKEGDIVLNDSDFHDVFITPAYSLRQSNNK